MVGIYKSYKPLTNEQIEKGDWTRDELIENYIPLALATAKKFPKKYIDPDEAIGIALITLVKCVDSKNKIESATQFTSYIQSSIFNRLKEYCHWYHGRSIIRNKSRKSKPVKVIPINDNLNVCYKHYFEIDIQDTINKIVSTPTEKVIIERLLQGGYTNKDIAEELKCSRQWVGVVREEVLERLLCELKK